MRTSTPVPTPTATRERLTPPQAPPATGTAGPAGVAVELIACGAAGHGDDGAPIVAVQGMEPELHPDVEVRYVEQLTIDDLLAIPGGAGVVIVDSADGVEPGWIVQLPLDGLAGRTTGIRPHGTHALEVPAAVGLASMIRGRDLVGRVVVVGSATHGLGDALSWPVRAASGALRLAIEDAIDTIRSTVGRETADRRS